MPVKIRLTAAPAAGPRPIAAYLADVAAGRHAMPGMVIVPVKDAPDAGMGPFLGQAAESLIAGCGVTDQAGDSGTIAPWAGGTASPWRLLFLGLGDRSPAAMRRAGAAAARQAPAGERVLTSVSCDAPAWAAGAFAEGLLLGGYRFTTGADGTPESEVVFLDHRPAQCRAALDRAAVIGGAVTLARDLANTPSSQKTPGWLAEQAVAAAGGAGIAARIWEEDELAAAGFGGLLAVGAGSAQQPRLIQLSHEPPGWREHYVLAGKGITFDSGGLSLKPSDGMKMMKTDMAGGAVVIAVMSALARLGAAARVTGLVAVAENMPSGSALRPGDVITHYGGRTVEVLNTDAEGRLVLADVLAYADAILRPDAMVDIATLTGAVRVALGSQTGALYASDERLAGSLLSAAAAAGEPLWRMPLADCYREGLDSPVADIANVAPAGGARAGSIDAALFLREFTGERSWAHLDVAGAARAAEDTRETRKGATGYGTRLLLEWLSAGPRPVSPPRAGRRPPA